MKISHSETDKYRIVEFFVEYAHMISSPNRSHLHRSHRILTIAQRAAIDLAEEIGQLAGVKILALLMMVIKIIYGPKEQLI